MNRKHIIIGLGVLLALALIAAFKWNGSSTRSANQAQVITQAGTVTIVPKDKFPKMTVIAHLPATNITNKSSSPRTESR